MEREVVIEVAVTSALLTGAGALLLTRTRRLRSIAPVAGIRVAANSPEDPVALLAHDSVRMGLALGGFLLFGLALQSLPLSSPEPWFALAGLVFVLEGTPRHALARLNPYREPNIPARHASWWR